MEEIPRRLYRVELGAKHVPTGKTRHFWEGKFLPPPHVLEIARYTGDDGFYLFYLDDDGTEMTDTYHDSLEEAFEQARWEFNVDPADWKRVDT